MSKPKEMTIADVLDLRRLPSDGEVIGSIAGKIKKVWEYKTGSGDHGEWSFQNIELVDGRDSIKVVLKDREELNDRDWTGVQVIISSTEGKKGWNGVKAKDDEYKGKTTRIAWVTGSADIAEDRGGAPAAKRDERDEREERPPRDEPRREERPAREERRPEPSRCAPPSTQRRYLPLGVTVGMAINCACANLTARGEDITPSAVGAIASDLLRLSKWLEEGNLVKSKRSAAPAPKREEQRPPVEEKKKEDATPPPTEEPPNESDDVPF